MQIWSKTLWKKLFFWKMAKIAQNHHLKFSKIILLLKADYLETKKGFCHKKPNHWPFRWLHAAFSEFFWKILKNLKSANSLALVTWAHWENLPKFAKNKKNGQNHEKDKFTIFCFKLLLNIPKASILLQFHHLAC